MKVFAWIVGVALIGSAVTFGFLGGSDRPNEPQDSTPNGTATEAEQATTELVAASEVPEAVPEEELIDFDPWLDGKRTTAPKLEELSYENPIVQYHPDRSVTTHKLARITDPDGTVREVPVQMHATLVKKPMKVSRRGAGTTFQARLDENGNPIEMPRLGEGPNQPGTSGSQQGTQLGTQNDQ